MKVLVVGANGQIGKQVVSLMKDNDALEATAMIRNVEQAPYFETMEAQTVVADLEDDIDALAKAAEGMDAIVFTAGSGPHTGKDKTIMVDLDGAIKTIEAAKRANVKRFIMISSFDTTREAIQEASESFAPYVIAKHYADKWLRASDLQHTIIHPGLLTNDAGNGEIEAATNVARDKVPRADIAEVIVSCLESDATIGKEFQVVKGTTPIKKAMINL